MLVYRLKCLLLDIASPIMNFIGRLRGINNNKIIFVNYNGLGFGDNPKVIAQALHKLNPNLEIIWLVNKYSEMPSWIKQSKLSLPFWHYHISTAKVWVSNSRLGRQYDKKGSQYYIQTWHGCIALKRIEKDAEGALTQDGIDVSKRDSKMTNLYISNGKWCTDMYRRAFWYDGEILECGSPRCDYMINSPHGDGRVYRYYGLSETTKIILYAPTFRKDLSNPYNIDLYRLISTLRELHDTEYKVVVRLHPMIQDKEFFSFDDMILNGNDYPDLYELLAECEMLITDYSSSMFEMSYIRKPVILYSQDIDEYINDRGFYFDLKKLPFPIATNNEQLIYIVERFNKEKYNEDVSRFLDYLKIQEGGKASETVANHIINVLASKN